MFRYLMCLLGLLLALPILALVILAFNVPITISGIGYLLASLLLAIGLISAPWYQKNSLLVLLGVLGIALVAGTRFLFAVKDQNTSNLHLITLPEGKSVRLFSYLVDEQDLIVFGETLFHFIGGDSAAEHKNIATALAADYTDMRSVHKVFPSPVPSTYLNLQGPKAFDAIIVEPQVNSHPLTAVIFLHGYMGNVAVQCWEIAQAVGRFGAITVCPSTDWTGQWWQPRGKAILEATFEYLRAQGIQEFYLGGFSNGGFGISRLTGEIENQAGISGLFFINGISNSSDIGETGLPVLIIQGTGDERVPVEGTRQIAYALANTASYTEVDGDHFMIIKNPKPLQNTIAGWLEKTSLDK